MRSTFEYNRTAQQAAVQPFATRVRAVDPMAHIKMASIFALAVLTVLVAGIISMNSGNASQVHELTNLAPQGMIATKGDRTFTTPVTDTCNSQAWGAWTSECAAQLTGANKVRNISFVTVEKQPMTVNETILARYPTTN